LARTKERASLSTFSKGPAGGATTGTSAAEGDASQNPFARAFIGKDFLIGKSETPKAVGVIVYKGDSEKGEGKTDLCESSNQSRLRVAESLLIHGGRRETGRHDKQKKKEIFL